MADAIAAPRRRGWIRKLGWAVVCLIVLLIVLYFVVTSSAFFKGVVLPKVSKSLNANVTVGDASIHPFSGVDFRQLKIQITGSEPLLQADEVRVVYHLGDILGGNYHVEEITVVSPTVEIITHPDGSSNLDPLLKKGPPQPAGPAKPSQPSKPPTIDLNKIALKNATVRIIKEYAGGGRDVTVLTNINIELGNLKNGGAGKLTLGANLSLDNHPTAPGTNASLQATASGSFTFNLGADLTPSSVNGSTRFAVQNASGGMGDLAGLEASLNCDITPTEIKQVFLQFQKSGGSLGGVRASGPFNMATKEGHIEVVVSPIDRQVLNLLGAQNGIDFGTTTINSTNTFDFARGGALITMKGSVDVARMALTAKNETSPPLNLHLDYHVIVDRLGNSALLQTINLNGTQNQQPFLHADLASPMAIAWGANSNTVGDSALKLTVTNFNLAEWKPFMNGAVSSRNLNLNLNLVSKQGGKLLAVDLVSQLQNFTAAMGSNQIQQTDLTLQAHGQAQDLTKIDLSDYRLQVTQQSQPMITISGSAQYDPKAPSADIQVTLEAACAKIFQAMGQSDINASSGTATFKGHLLRKEQGVMVTGNFTLADLTGHYKTDSFNGFGTILDLDIAQNGGQLQINKITGTMGENGHAGGKFDLSGNFDTQKHVGQLTLNLVDLNENGLRPFLASALGGKQLVSVSINSTTTANYASQGDSSVKTELQVANLVVRNPADQSPSSPLEAKLQVDASLHNQVANVNKFVIALTPTSQAANQLNLTGQVDMSHTNAIQGGLKLESESLDFTHYYDLFAAKSEAAKGSRAAKPATPATPSSASSPPSEPAPVNLPLQNFQIDAKIGRLLLREVAITNFQTSINLDGGHVVIKPFQLSLNGAPINAAIDLDLGVAGYRYDVFLGATNIPVAPLADSFSPTYKGQAKGDLFANAQIKGAGVTGAGLKRNLSGNFAMVFTNADIKLVGKKVRMIITPIAAALRLTELTQSVINQLSVEARIDNGTINLTQFKAVSPAFIASSQGTISLADVLTNSPINNLPVDFSLPTSLAKKANLAPSSMNTNAAYVNLGKIATVSGTVGDPKTKTDYKAILLLTGQAMEGLPGNVGKEGGKILKGVGGLTGLLGGKNGANTNTSTNQSSTNSPAGNPFDLLRKVVPK